MPHRIIFSVVAEADLPVLSGTRFQRVEVAFGPKGLARQRNLALNLVLKDSDIVAFFDDDYVPSHNALVGLVRSFSVIEDVSGLTGKLLADGARGPGISLDAAKNIVDAWDAGEASKKALSEPRAIVDLEGLYGCNMAFRAEAIGDTRFDERLPLYGWLGDIDFASRVSGMNKLTSSMFGVHCGVKSGRE